MMTKKQIKERRNYIGASEIHHVLNLEPYGCARRLWYEKTGQKEDYPRLENNHMERGTYLEPIVKKLLTKKYKYQIEKVQPKTYEKYPVIRASIDGLITAQNKQLLTGNEIVLEIKCPSKEMMYQFKKGGVPEAYILQLQVGMACWNVSRGLFAIFNADLWELLVFDIRRDEDLIESITLECKEFWGIVERQTNLDSNEPVFTPDLLSDGDKRCSVCAYRKTCRGQDWESQCNGIGFGEFRDYSNNPIYAEAITNYRNAKEVYDEAEALMDIEKEKLQKLLGNDGRVVGCGAKIYFEPQERTSCDRKRCRKEIPKIYSKYAGKIRSRPMRIVLD